MFDGDKVMEHLTSQAAQNLFASDRIKCCDFHRKIYEELEMTQMQLNLSRVVGIISLLPKVQFFK